MTSTSKSPAKCCSKCGETKPLADFYRHQTGRDGRMGECKECNRARVRAWHRTNAERRRITVQEWRRRNPERVAAIASRRSERDPEKLRARRVLKEAVREGRLEKPDRCEDCGEQFERRLIHGHHENYSRPLEVDWLCAGCHLARHGGSYFPPVPKSEEAADA